MNVIIEHQVVISTHGEKARPVPADLIQEHDGRQWLKLRPTNYGINQIICGSKGGKMNASFSNHEDFQALLQKRNKVWAKAHADQDAIFDSETKEESQSQITQKKARKRKHAAEAPEIVEVPWGGQTIECLMQGRGQPNLTW